MIYLCFCADIYNQLIDHNVLQRSSQIEYVCLYVLKYSEI